MVAELNSDSRALRPEDLRAPKIVVIAEFEINLDNCLYLCPSFVIISAFQPSSNLPLNKFLCKSPLPSPFIVGWPRKHRRQHQKTHHLTGLKHFATARHSATKNLHLEQESAITKKLVVRSLMLRTHVPILTWITLLMKVNLSKFSLNTLAPGEKLIVTKPLDRKRI